LHDKGLVFQALGESNLLVEGWEGHQVSESIVDSKSGRLSSALDTSLRDKLASAATLSIDVLLSSQ
jgi:hypothetical protein